MMNESNKIKLKNVKYFESRAGLTIKGSIIKNGLDTSRLVNLIICFDSPEEFKMNGFPAPPNLFFINEISFSEAKGILINRFKYAADKATNIIRKWKSEFCISEIKKDKNSEDFEKIVRKENIEIVKQLGPSYMMHDPDIIIVAGFLREKINIIHAKDKGLEETCKKLGFNVIPTPEKHLEKEKAIKEQINKSK